MSITFFRVFLVALCAASSLSAQRTWVVDSARGPGFDFADLQPAFNAARHGDTVIVRKGLYAPATTNKGLFPGMLGAELHGALEQNDAIMVRQLLEGAPERPARWLAKEFLNIK